MKYHHHKIKIETLTPLHIGDGNSLTSIGEFKITSNKIQFINTEKLVDDLDESQLNQYTNKILEKEQNTDAWVFLEKNLGIDLGNYISREIDYNCPANFDSLSNNRILELAVTTEGEKYIPGSSLKGAIRNVIFAYLIFNSNFGLKDSIEQIIKNNGFEKIKNQIEKEEKKHLDKDFKYIRPQDSNIITNDAICGEIAKRRHFLQVEPEVELLRECIKEGYKIDMTLSILTDHISIFDFLQEKKLNRLFNLINKITEHYIDFEIKHLNNLLTIKKDEVTEALINFLKTQKTAIDKANGKYAILRMGKGKTYFFQTILPFLSEDTQEKLLTKMLSKRVNGMNLKIEKENKENNSSLEKIVLGKYIEKYPQTRILTKDNQMFGWVKLYAEDFDEFGKFKQVQKKKQHNPGKQHRHHESPKKQKQHNINELIKKYNTTKNKKR